MVIALGFSHNDFNPAEPGRLCRGRERWIEPFPLEERPDDIHRLVVSGATFSDDSARDALRGLPHSGLDLAELIASVFPGQPLIAFMEDGHPADIPGSVEGVELYAGHRAGGLSEEMLVRWYKPVSTLEEIRELLGTNPMADRVRGFVPVTPDVDLEALWQQIFAFVGMSTLDSPPARYQPAALPDLLEMVGAVIVVHLDKHGPALGIYSAEPVDMEERLLEMCAQAESLPVRFAIPPMLARWDRALAEARGDWERDRDEPFPVPVSEEPSTWEPRWRRRQQKKSDAKSRADRDDLDFDGEE